MQASSSPRPQASQAIQQYFHDSETTGTKEEWALKPELPTADEILGNDSPGDDVFLAPNHLFRPWESTQSYLETHYKLVREDSVAPLRDAVAYVRSDPYGEDTNNFSIYEKVYIVGATLTNRGLAFTLRFSTRRAGRKILWKYSNRLIDGSVVALSPAQDAFSSQCVVATVAARPLDKVNRDPPEINIFFADPADTEFDPQKEWIMVEARAGYYEAHRHTMTALQKLSTERFPLSNHICHLDRAIGTPEYVTANPLMNFRALSQNVANPFDTTMVNVLEAWPNTPMGEMDGFQWAALREMLTKRLAIVQGPPGTGKTYVSVAALKVLLSNMSPGDPPIIIAAQTNHALDQFLTHISQFEPNYIRLGRRSTDPEIRRRSLFSVRNAQGKRVEGGVPQPTKKEHQRLVDQIVKILSPFSRLDEKGPIESLSFLECGLITRGQYDSLQRGSESWVRPNPEETESPMAQWLGDQSREFQVDFSSPDFADDEIDLEYEQLRQIEAQQGLDEDTWEGLSGKFIALAESLHAQDIDPELEAIAQDYLQNTDLWAIPLQVRGLVYSVLRHRLVEILTSDLRDVAQLYEACCKRFRIGNLGRDCAILQGAKVVGMTTTGLNKYRGLVASLNPRVVVIEEAAEVIEAPVTAACFESLQQLILIGDHQQLKGQCAVRDLAGDPFYLDISMFERLVRNNIPFTRLQEQRRMAPEIRVLLTPIYGHLHDHPLVHDRDLVPGMGDVRLFFLTHNFREDNDNLASKFNEFEAAMVTEFYAYLVMNGISDRKITILTFYQGQKKKILKMAKTHQHLASNFVNVVTVDSYQGEENDIILLSLVRSNEDENNGIGFLTVESRVCVALSRAKCGLYIFGNAGRVSSASPLWRRVVNMMSEPPSKPRLGMALPLTCQTHKRRTMIQAVSDWKKIQGGCNHPCRQVLACGHNCPMQCHGPDHNQVPCQRPCGYQYPCCRAICLERCSLTHDHQCSRCRANAPTPATAVSTLAIQAGTDLPIRQPGDVEAQSRWREFARGGARETDRAMEVLTNARSANEEGVQQAMRRVDERLIPQRLREVRAKQKKTKDENLIDLD